MITVKDFIKEFDESTEKENCIEKHIINQYVSYMKKIDECKHIVNLTSFDVINGKKIYKKSTAIQYFQYICRLILNYTDIELSYDQPTIDFDELNSRNIINVFLSKLPSSEVEEWSNILAMTNDDLYENSRSLVAWLDNKFEAYLGTYNMMLDTLKDNIEEM